MPPILDFPESVPTEKTESDAIIATFPSVQPVIVYATCGTATVEDNSDIACSREVEQGVLDCLDDEPPTR